MWELYRRSFKILLIVTEILNFTLNQRGVFMKKILIVSDREIVTEDIAFFYEVHLLKTFEAAAEILSSNEEFEYGIFENMNGIKEFISLITNANFMLVNPVVFSKEATKSDVLWFFRNGVYDIVENEITQEEIMNIIDRFDDRRPTRYTVKVLDRKKRILEEEISEYQVLYETTKILRMNLNFEGILEKLLNLIEGITGGTGFFILHERYFYSKNGDWTKIHLIKRFLKANKKNSLSSFVESIPSYFPFYFESTVWRMFPIIIRNSIKGYMLLIKDFSNDLKDHEIEVINNILSQAGIVIDNAHLIEETREIHFDIVKSLVKAIEGKDKYTKGHSERVSFYSTIIANELELSHDNLKKLQMAAVLHDVGKIAVPENILNKEGKISDEEFAEIKKHPSNGYTIVSQIKNMKEIAVIIKYHHERWDGKGYPEGIAKEEIPLESRIISVADAYDAMTSDRPYRKGMGHEKAIEELKKNREKQFDSEIVDIFCEISRSRLYYEGV